MNKTYIFAVLVLILLGLGLYAISRQNADMTATINQPALTSETVDTTSTMNPTDTTQPALSAQNGDLVAVHYTGKLTSGKVFDTSLSRGEPIVFPLGAGAVIPGWEKGILGMKIGDKKTLMIAPEDAYGATGVKNPQTGEVVIPGNATLVFDVELVDIQRQ
jgi:FKBP-type peptidyl-prolyl cis-trans isomerase